MHDLLSNSEKGARRGGGAAPHTHSIVDYGAAVVSCHHAVANAFCKRASTNHFKLARENFRRKSRAVAVSEKDFDGGISVFEKVGHPADGTASP